MITAIREENIEVPTAFLCHHFGVSKSGYYAWKRPKGSIRFVKKEDICAAIRKSFSDSHGTYGSPRIYDELKGKGFQVSENTVAKYMTEMGLDARLKKKFRVQTTNSNHDGPIADRLLRVEEEYTLPTAPEQVLAGDITYLRLGQAFIYLAVVIDIFTREVVGWSMSRSLETKIVLDALSAAMANTTPDAEVIFHSDRGSQYASEAYRKLCSGNGVLPSMSRKGNCYDNCYVESWFSSLKKEWIYRKPYSTEEELRALVFEYIEIWYNRERKHSALGYLSPRQYREVCHVAH